MKRKIGLAVCIATLGVISIQCSSEDPADDNGTAGAPPVTGGGGNTNTAGQPSAGKANVAGGGATSLGGGGSGGASAGAPGTAGKAGGGAGSGSGGSPSGGVGGASGGASGGVGGTKAGGGSGGGSAGGGGTAKTFADVQNIMNMRCATGACHGPGQTMHTNFKADLYKTLTTPLPEATDCGGTTLVAKGNPEMSFLVQVIEGKATCAPEGNEIERMPYMGMALGSGEIDTIKSWITAGAPM